MTTARIMTPPDVPVWRLSVEQYRQMAESGILTEDDPVELLEGLLVEKARKTPQHVYSVRTLFHRLYNLMPEGWFAGSQHPFDTLDSEPEPDCSLIRGTIDDYAERFPVSADLGLVVEVSDATLARDRWLKLRIYARAGIPTYWIVNLVDRQLEVHTEPYTEDGISGYRQCSVFGESDSVALILDGHEIAQIGVAEILPQTD